ncbi:DNA helicase [Chelatococcus asaccharovorans]|uniref:KaiC protein n=1 Tax=Chelatococcus asaccharovorans TaxID=28210 RepID=A0A2V3UGR4_9HYPH|nr:DNA helicase [Chelatococcus asaccharovorans]MBS7703874.1 DNA helicase [Chelatococcus asaccharovorans]PXW58036.1 KaiC protein [Chelatococcus asaccharovorans]
MKLSAPIPQLKRKAKLLSRRERIPLHTALDRIAAGEGFKAWSLLAAKVPKTIPLPVGELYARLSPGDLILVGARPGQGKTLMSLKLAIEAIKFGNHGVFFTLEYTERDVLDRFRVLGVDWTLFRDRFVLDASDAISADYIVDALRTASRGTLVVIDYLQLLDQKRETPALVAQVRKLKSFAEEQGLILLFISQIDRSYDPAMKPCPDISDVRLPNPLDLSLFNKTCFLQSGDVCFQVAT